MTDSRMIKQNGFARSVIAKSLKERRLSLLKKNGARFIFFLCILIIWQFLASAGFWSELLFPTPGQVFASLLLVFTDGSMPEAISSSMKRLITGYAISLLIGIPFGMLLGRVSLLDNTFGTLTLGLQALPSICWMPLAVLWFGLSEATMQFVVIMGSVMALILSVRDGVKNIPRLYIRASRVLGATGLKSYLYVIFPASLPSLLTGARLGWTFAWRALMAAELIYVSTGLGSTLMMGRELHDMAQVVATMIVIIIIGLITDRAVFGTLERAMHRRWGVSSQ